MKSTKIFYALVTLFTLACGSKVDSNKDARFDGNRKMVALLDSLSKAANTAENYYLSEARASTLLSKKPAKFSSKVDKLNWNLAYNNELLCSGKTEEAAKNLVALLQEENGSLDGAIKIAEYKSLYEMLAITYLRMGEMQNCLTNHNAASCILPFSKEAEHKNKTGSEKAVEVYTILLDQYPKDIQSRWLLNLANMTLGKYPDGVPEKFRIPVEAFKKPKTDIKPFVDVAIPLGLDRSALAGGACLEDFNNDGFLDVFCTSYGLFDNVKLFLSNGDGTFKDATESAQLNGITGGLNCKQADFNNDGFMDMLVLRGAWLDVGGEWPNSLLKNNGDGTFSDVTFEAGMVNFRPTETAAWADFNGDGLLDIFVANENNKTNAYPCELWANKGNGKFEEIAKKCGVDGNFGWVKGAVWSDLNNDGRPDLYLSAFNGNNRLFMNRGGSGLNWKFEDIGKKAGVEKPFYSFPTAIFDYDNDGDNDIFCADFDKNRLTKVGEDAARYYLGMPALCEMPRFYRNNGDETFTDVTKELGLNRVTYAMGLNIGDIDNDGWIDFYCGTGAFEFNSLMPNLMFRNVEGKRFEDVSMIGFGHLQKGHGISFGDIDNDGDQDIYETLGGAFLGDKANNILFQNPNSYNKWITITLQGKTVVRSAIESKIKVNVLMADGKKRSIYSTVSNGGTFGANSLQQEIGLGNAKEIESVEVFWEKPGFPVTKYTGFGLNSFVKIVEGESQPIKENRKAIVLNTENKEHQHN